MSPTTEYAMRKFVRCCFIATAFCLFSSLGNAAEDLKIIAWNVESGGSDPAVIAEQLKEMSGYQIYVLSEVDKKEFERFKNAVGTQFKSIEGTHKENDHLQIIYDADRLEVLSWAEMEEQGEIKFNRENRALRCPLFARFKFIQSGEVFQLLSLIHI